MTIKPTVYYTSYGESKVEPYSTFKELRQWLTMHISLSDNDIVTIIRSKRGEWGEWFEKWTMTDKGKVKIIEEGWM